MKQTLLILAICFTFIARGQSQTNLGKALEEGNASQLSSFFSTNIELDIPKSKGVFNKKQATIVLENFFSKNQPTKYFQKHQGGGNDKAHFEIGALITTGNKYRTYLLYNLVENKPQIIELRIELED